MCAQQFVGIDGVLYYSPILFRQAGLSGGNANFLASGVSSLVILATTIPATIWADKWGRRTSSIVGGTCITIIMLIIGTMYAADLVHPNYGAGRWVVIISIYLFAIVFNGTWALAFRTFLVESLPRRTRSSASSLGQCSNWVGITYTFSPGLWTCLADRKRRLQIISWHLRPPSLLNVQRLGHTTSSPRGVSYALLCVSCTCLKQRAIAWRSSNRDTWMAPRRRRADGLWTGLSYVRLRP